jgi:hypothetical protein
MTLPTTPRSVSLVSAERVEAGSRPANSAISPTERPWPGAAASSLRMAARTAASLGTARMMSFPTEAYRAVKISRAVVRPAGVRPTAVPS